MALTIDLYECESHELEQHISNPQITNDKLEFYVKEVMKLIEQQKAEDKEEFASSPRSRGRQARRKQSDALDIDTISVASSTTSRSSRRIRNRKSRKSSKSIKIDDDSEAEDIDMDDFDGIAKHSKQNSVEYEWMSGINDMNDMDKSDSSSMDDPLLNLDLTNLDDHDYNMVLADTQNKPSKKSLKKKKRKHKKDKKHKKHKKKKKKKKKKGKTEDDDDYLISSDDDWDTTQYEQRIMKWSTTQLEKEAKSLERQIEEEKQKQKQHQHSNDNNHKEESEDENLNNLTIEEIQEKFRNKLNDITRNKYREDPTKLYCICREPYDGTTQMICCDYCQEWYHLSCIGLSADKLASVEKLKFKCPVCNGADPNEITNHIGGGGTTNNHTHGASFDSPKSTPNPPTHPRYGNMEKLHKENSKYKKLIEELQRRLRESKSNMKKQAKEMAERLNKAKRDIDEERRMRMAVEKHMKGAKEKSDSMVKELGESFQHQKQKEAELVNKLKKLEANKKKYKESATENKRKMKQLKEEYEEKLNELENEVIPTLNMKIKSHDKKNRELESKITALQQQSLGQQQQAQQSINTTYAQYTKAQTQLNVKSAEAAKLQNLNSQIQHKMDTLHVQAQHNHQQWENISKVKDDKIGNFQKQIQALQQQNNALRSNNNMPQVIINNSTSNSNSSQNTPRPPSPIKIPVVPGYLKFNDLELEELKMCRELCQKLLEANLFQVDHMAARASLTRELFVSWVTGIGKSPTVINDLNQATMGTLPPLDPQQHLSMNCIRLLLIEIRKQLENISQDTQSHEADIISKVKSLLREFQTASQSYEQKMNEFKLVTHNRLIEGCRTQGNVLEMYCVIGTNDNNEPKSEWIKVTVCNFDQQANRVLVRKASDNSMSYAAIDSATLRLPENDENNNNNNQNQIINVRNSNSNSNTNSNSVNSNINVNPNGINVTLPNVAMTQTHSNGNNNNGNTNSHSGTNSLSISNNIPVIQRNNSTQNSNVNVARPPNNNILQQPYWNTNNPLNRARSTPINNTGMAMSMPGMMGMAMGATQMNFTGIPSFPTMTSNVLPPFNDLQANNISSQHHINNTINTNNNISINGNNNNLHNEPIVLDEDKSNGNGNGKPSTQSQSRKRKRNEHESSHSHSKHKSHKKKKKSKHKHNSVDSDSDSSSDSDSDISSDSDTESESESVSKISKHKSKKSKKKKSKKHKHKSKKHKKSKKSKKKHKKDKHIKQEQTKKRKRGRPPKKSSHEMNDSDNRSVSMSSTASTRKRRGTKRQLSLSAKQASTHGNGNGNGNGNGMQVANPSKKRKMNKNDYDVIDGGGDSDKNDSVCRVCKHPGDLVCCEGCPSAYHADCVRPRVQQKWLDQFDDWYCPSCAPRNTYIPLKNKNTNEKWPMHKEPLLQDMKEFIKTHPFLERDYEPLHHPSRKK